MADVSISTGTAVDRSGLIARRTIHAVGHFHLDPLWLWDKSDGLERFRSTVRAALDLMERNPEMTLAASSAALYAYLQRVDGDLFARVAEMVRIGRWEPVGGMWVEADEHVPGGEAYIRQLLLGQEFFARHFGRIARVGWSPDSFGRYAQLPRLLAGAGLEFFVFKRPERNQKRLPDLFYWAAEDGSRVLTCHLHEYMTFATSLPRRVRDVARDLREPYRHGLFLYGVGNHGGGPTQANIDEIRRLESDPSLPSIVFDTPTGFFETVRGSGVPIPEVLDHLDYFVGGGYATNAALKAAYRQTEHLLVDAETAASAASYSQSPLRRGWERLAFNHFHDTAAGTCIPEVYPAVFDELAEARSIARDVSLEALHALSNEIDIPYAEGTQPVVVFNSAGHTVRRLVPLNLQLSDPPPDDGDPTSTHVLVDSEGGEVLMQLLRARSAPAHRAGFMAEVPPLGYVTYRLRPRAESDAPPLESLPDEEGVLENDRLRLTLDADTGAIAELWDKQHGLRVFNGPAAQPVLVVDPGSAWGPRRYDTPHPDLQVWPVALKRSQHGPLLSAIQVHSVFERAGVPTGSRLMQEFRIYRDLPCIDVTVRLSWHEHGAALKLAFPVNIQNYPEATAEIPHGTTTYPTDGVEVPALTWVDVTGESPYTDAGVRWHHGVTLANTGRYSYAFTRAPRQATIWMMLARGNPYTFTPYAAEAEGIDVAYEDDGDMELDYCLVPHLEGWREAETYRAAQELNRPLQAMLESAHAGTRPPVASVFSISHPNVVLGALKRSEDGRGLVVRLIELHGELSQGVEVECMGVSFTADFFPTQVKTFLIDLQSGEAKESDLLER
jgi:alpha-mannosidase